MQKDFQIGLVETLAQEMATNEETPVDVFGSIAKIVKHGRSVKGYVILILVFQIFIIGFLAGKRRIGMRLLGVTHYIQIQLVPRGLLL